MTGVVIRPVAFARVVSPRAAVALRRKRRRWIDGRIAALLIAGAGLAGILALAGTAFAVRTVLVLCFAALAGRARRVGTPVRS